MLDIWRWWRNWLNASNMIFIVFFVGIEALKLFFQGGSSRMERWPHGSPTYILSALKWCIRKGHFWILMGYEKLGCKQIIEGSKISKASWCAIFPTMIGWSESWDFWTWRRWLNDEWFTRKLGIFTGKHGSWSPIHGLKHPETMARPGSLLGCPVSNFLEPSLGMLMFRGAKNLRLETVRMKV